MNYSDNSIQNLRTVIGAEPMGIVPRQPGFLGTFLGRTGGTLAEDIQADAELALFRMQLTDFALNRIIELSVIEQQMIRLTPHAAERYQAIVDACTRQTIEQIKRW